MKFMLGDIGINFLAGSCNILLFVYERRRYYGKDFDGTIFFGKEVKSSRQSKKSGIPCMDKGVS